MTINPNAADPADDPRPPTEHCAAPDAAGCPPSPRIYWPRRAALQQLLLHRDAHQRHLPNLRTRRRTARPHPTAPIPGQSAWPAPASPRTTLHNLRTSKARSTGVDNAPAARYARTSARLIRRRRRGSGGDGHNRGNPLWGQTDPRASSPGNAPPRCGHCWLGWLPVTIPLSHEGLDNAGHGRHIAHPRSLLEAQRSTGTARRTPRAASRPGWPPTRRHHGPGRASTSRTIRHLASPAASTSTRFARPSLRRRRDG